MTAPLSESPISAADGGSEAPASSQATALAIVARLAPASPGSAEMLAVLSGPLGQAIETAATFADGRLAASTRRAYERDWRNFAAWCRTQKVNPAVLPVHPVLVAAYLASLVPALGKSGLKARAGRDRPPPSPEGASLEHPPSGDQRYPAGDLESTRQADPSVGRADLHGNPPAPGQLRR